MAQVPQVSVVSPVFQSAGNIPVLVSRILYALEPQRITCEIVLVDDGSTDDSWEVIRSLSLVYPQVKGIRLDRNYGQHPAIRVGLSYCCGEQVVIMDCDLQDPPECISALLEKLHDPVEAVFARRIKQYESRSQLFLSRAFYRVLQALTGIPLDGSVANFGAYSRSMIQAVLHAPDDRYFFFPLAIRKCARNCVQVKVPHEPRHSGHSSYTVLSAGKLAFRILSSQTFLHYFYTHRRYAYHIQEITEQTVA